MEWLRLIGGRLSIGLLFTVLILTFWVIHLHHQRQIEMRRAMEHATDLSSSLEDVFSAVRDAELGERGYLITGRPEELESYRAARSQLHELMERLRTRTAGDPAQRQRFQALEPLISARLAELWEAIEARREHGFEAAEAVVLANARRGTAQAIRAEISEVQRENKSRLNKYLQPTLGLGAMLGTAALSGLIAFGLTGAGFHLGRRKDALEEAIRQNEALLRAVLAQMPSGVIIADASGRLLLGNAQMERIWGRPFHLAASIADYRPEQGFHSDGRPYEPSAWPLARALNGGETTRGEIIYFRRGDRTCGAIEVSSAPIRNEFGQIVAGVATFHDVTERYEAERRLRESEEQLRLALEAGGFAVWNFDFGTGLSGWSDNLLDLPGLASAQNRWTPEAIRQWLNPEDWARVEAEFEAMRQGRRPMAVELRLKPDGGTERWVACYGRLVTDAAGKPVRVIGLAQDIGPRKRIEEELRKSQRTFKSLVEHLPDVVFRLDRELRYLYMSPAAESYTGFKSEELPGKTVREMGFDPDHCDRFEALCREVLASGEERRFEFTDRGLYHRCRLVAERGADGGVESILGLIEDVTAQELAERALRESEGRLRFIVEHSPDCIFIQDRNLRYLWVSRVTPPMTQDDCLGKTDFDLFIPYEARQLTTVKQRVMAKKRPESAELVLTIQGQVRYFEATYAPWFCDFGQVSGVAGYVREITERKEAELHREQLLRELEHEHTEVLALGRELESRLWEAEEKQHILEALMDYIPEGIAIATAPEVRIQMISRHGQQLAGHPAGVLEGLSVASHAQYWGFYHGDGVTPAGADELPLVRAIRQGETVTNEEWLFKRPDGAVIPILCNAGPIRDSAGRIGGGILAFRDITERKKADAALLRSEERLRLAQRAATAGVWDWDMTSGELSWSDEAFQLFGLEPGSLDPTGERWLSVVHPDDRERVKTEVFSCLIDNQEFFQMEYRIMRPDGAMRWIEDRGQIFYGADGKPVRMLGINIDITRRKETEETLQEADRRKDEFLAMLAHELRNPLAPIRNAIEVLRRLESEDSKQQWVRSVLERQVLQLTRLVDDLLDVSRITRGKIRLKKEIVDLGAIVEQALESSHPLIRSRRHTLSVTPAPEPVKIEGDQARLVQIIGNLLNNAAKYTPEGGHIEIQVEAAPQQAVVRIRDNGVGISPELLPHVFEPFRQADESLARSQGGLGLGLTLAQRLAELHGGRLSAYSEGVGHGAMFTMALPRVKKAA